MGTQFVTIYLTLSLNTDCSLNWRITDTSTALCSTEIILRKRLALTLKLAIFVSLRQTLNVAASKVPHSTDTLDVVFFLFFYSQFFTIDCYVFLYTVTRRNHLKWQLIRHFCFTFEIKHSICFEKAWKFFKTIFGSNVSETTSISFDNSILFIQARHLENSHEFSKKKKRILNEDISLLFQWLTLNVNMHSYQWKIVLRHPKLWSV